MSEGQVYPCKWKKAGERYVVWVERRPKLRAEGETLEDAVEELGNVVCLRAGDGEAVFELDPPPDGNGGDEYVALNYNQSWGLPAGYTPEQYGSLYEGGICRACRRGIGPRTKTPLTVGYLSSGDLLGARLSSPPILLASDRFRQLLTPKERSQLIWRPIQMARKARRTFFELEAKAPIAMVVDRDKPFSGWRCSECNTSFVRNDGYDSIAVAEADVPSPAPKLLTIDRPSFFPEIAVTRARWREMRGKEGAKGIVTKRVVFLPKKAALRRPAVRTLTKAEIVSINRQLDMVLRGE